MTRLRRHTLLLTLFVAGATFAETNDFQANFSSGEQRVALIELYTSEGCSSCPPADRWFSKLRSDPGLWKEFTPIALHVDYWDYIGWDDRFARREFSDRQRRYVTQGGARFVYTPGFFSNGQEWQGWRIGMSARGDQSNVGDLNVLVDGDDIVVRFDSSRESDTKLIAHIAVLGMNLETRVRAGENDGKTLRHDFVALGMTAVPLEVSSGVYKGITRLPDTSMHPRVQALVAWVSEAGKQAPIQSVGGYLRQ